MSSAKVRKHSRGYSLTFGEDVIIFFDKWDIASPVSTQEGSLESHIRLFVDECIVAMVSGRKMKEVQAALSAAE